MWQTLILPSAALLALAIILTVPSAYAEPFVTLEKGKDYTRQYMGTQNGEYIYKWTSTPEKILYDDQYHDYILTETATEIKVETLNLGSFVFDKVTCSYDLYNPGFIDELNAPVAKNISWTVKGKAATASTWSNLNSINSATCNVSLSQGGNDIRIIGERSTSSGTFQIVLEYNSYTGIKETMRGYNNNPAWNNHNIGFTETFEVPRIIQFGNKTYDLANYNGTTFGRTWIENNQAKLIHLSDKMFYDFGIGYDNLDSVKVSWDGSTAKLSMNYLFVDDIMPYQSWFEVDPTFSQTGTWYRVLTTSGAGASCPGAPYSNSTTQNVPVLSDSDDAGGVCGRGGFKYILTTIPDAVTILDVDFNLTGTAIENGGGNCNLGYVSTWQPDRTAAQQWTDIGSMSNYLTNNALCTSATFQSFDLGAQAVTDVQNSLASNKYVLGLKFTTETRSSVADTRFSHSGGALTIVYVSGPPNPASNFNADPQARKVQYTWTASGTSDVTGYYLGRSLNNVTFTNKTSVGLVTSYLDTAYYRPGLVYYVNITATNGLNSTSVYDSFTMDDYPGAPENFYRTLTSATAVKLNWSPPTDDGGSSVTGYRVEASTSYLCTGFSTLVNHTTDLNYNHTALATGQQYCYRVAAWNGVGMGDYTSTLLRFDLPDPINDLVISAVGLTNIDIAWSTPNLNGGTLSGYQINYTTPSGTPLTIISNNTLSVLTSYSVTGLQQDTAYCFRVAAWTQYGTDTDGNIECTTTYVLANFTIGFFDVNSTNPEQVPIRYERSELNSTATNVKVIYPNTADLDCLLDFSFAQSQSSYENITGSTYDTDQDYEDFVFANSGNDVITIDCTNANNNDTARYVVTQNGSFELLNMIQNFRSGEYGTMGMIGSLDLITVLVVIISMIGFNRVSGQVGIIFNIFFIGAMAYLEIIDFDWVWLPALVLIAMVVILSTRKDG